MRRRLSYANVVSTIALVLAMSGGAFAASHYLINSTKQINPKVLRKLHGARGPGGPAGPNGAIGPQGIEGKEGPNGKPGPRGEAGYSALSGLPSGGIESGDFVVSTVASAPGEMVSTAVTFPLPLPILISDKWEILEPGGKTTHCLGRELAQQGYFCVYVTSEANVEAKSGHSQNPEVAPVGGAGRFGALLNWKAETAAPVRITGTWTVRAQ